MIFDDSRLIFPFLLGFLPHAMPLGFFLYQTELALEILTFANCQMQSLLHSCRHKVLAFYCGSDPTLYRSLASALKYLTFTSPSIYMHDQHETHLNPPKLSTL